MEALRTAVVGAGNMGRNHVRILSAMSDIELVAVVDPDDARALTTAPSVVHVSSVSDLPAVDAAIVATPTQSHAAVARELLSRGVHVLVEKPLASTADEAMALAQEARAAGVVLGVGHVERFNAAFGLLARVANDPLMLSFERLSPYTPRIDDSVVMDLMVHDLDLALWILGGYPESVQATGACVFSDTLDIASAVLAFPEGRIATLQSSRATQDKVRRISISERERFLVADSIRQDVLIKRETTVDFSESEGPLAYRQANIVEVPYLDRSGEPLARELRDFVQAVRERRDPLVTGEAGAAAVRLANEVEASALATLPASATER